MLKATSEQMAAWQGDGALWAQENVHARDPRTGRVSPLRLEAHEEAFLRAATARQPDGSHRYHICVACWPKREGKSFAAALIGAHRLCCDAHQDVTSLANSREQSKTNIFGHVVDIFTLSPNLRGLVRSQDVMRGELRIPALGNAMRCRAANWRTIQGEPINLLLCDELHAAEDNGDAYTVAAQQTEGGQIVIASQAGAPIQTNPLWRLHESKAAHVLFDYRQEVTTAWAKRLMAMAIADGSLTPAEFDYYWRNCWGATGLKLLPAGEVGVAAMAYREPRVRTEWEALWQSWGLGRPVAIGAGLDRAGVSATGDRTVWTVTARFEGSAGETIYRVVRCAVLPTGAESEVLAEVRASERIFGSMGAVRLESYQCADLVGKIESATLEAMTVQAKQRLYPRLCRLMREGRIGFPMDAGVWRDEKGLERSGLLKAELIGLEHEVQKGAVRYGTQSGHDDCADSLVWSLDAAESVIGQGWEPEMGIPMRVHRRR